MNVFGFLCTIYSINFIVCKTLVFEHEVNPKANITEVSNKPTLFIMFNLIFIWGLNYN